MTEALALHVEGMAEDDDEVPSPASLDLVMEDPDNRDAVAFLVDLATPFSRSVRINVTLPKDLIEQIDRRSKNRSGFLADAAREKLRAAS